MRVHNTALQVTDSEVDLFRYAEIETVLNSYMKLAAEHAFKEGVGGVESFLNEASVDVLHMYRVWCAKTTSPAQLILPESLKLLPIYMNAVLK